MKTFQFSLGAGMLMALVTGAFAFVSGSSALSGFPVPYMGSTSHASLSMDWTGLLVNIIAWSVIVYAVIFAAQRFGGKK